MNLTQIRKKAKKLKVNPKGLKKADLIKAIQKAEGNFECFGTAGNYCDQVKCSWRNDCLKRK